MQFVVTPAQAGADQLHHQFSLIKIRRMGGFLFKKIECPTVALALAPRSFNKVAKGDHQQ